MLGGIVYSPDLAFGQGRRLIKSLKTTPSRSAGAQIGSNSTQTGSLDSVQALAAASTSKKSQAEAIRQIPWEAFDPQTRQAVESLVARHSLYRRLPLAGGYCNPEIYDFLLCHPEAVVGLWQKLGYSQIRLDFAAPGRYILREGTGTTADVTVLYHDNRKMVIHCSGVYRGSAAAKPLEGETVVLLQYRFTEDAQRDFAPLAITRLDCFIRIKNPGVDLVSRTFGPLIGKIVDSNFVKTVDFVNSVSENAEVQPDRTAAAVLAIDGIDRQTLAELAAITLRSSGLAELRSRGERVDYFMVPKPNQPESEPVRLLSRSNDPARYQAAVLNPTYGAGEPESESAAQTATEIIEITEIVPYESDAAVDTASDTISHETDERFDSPLAGTEISALAQSSVPNDSMSQIPALRVYRLDTDETLPEGRRTVILLDSPIEGADPLKLYHESVRSSLSVEEEARLLPTGPLRAPLERTDAPIAETAAEPTASGAETGIQWKRPTLR